MVVSQRADNLSQAFNGMGYGGKQRNGQVLIASYVSDSLMTWLVWLMASF
jgi:hypothetical protein